MSLDYCIDRFVELMYIVSVHMCVSVYVHISILQIHDSYTLMDRNVLVMVICLYIQSLLLYTVLIN